MRINLTPRSECPATGHGKRAKARPSETVACARCGNRVTRVPSRAAKYCSRDCYTAARLGRPVAERFWAKVDKTGECWLWTGAQVALGYGRFGVGERGNYRSVPAHRYAWELANGPIPGGLFVCHRCDNPPCVRQDHLFLGTPLENTRDCIAKGRDRHERPTRTPLMNARQVRGERQHDAKLTEEAVRQIRERFSTGETRAALARAYGVRFNAIERIVKRITWKHVH